MQMHPIPAEMQQPMFNNMQQGFPVQPAPSAAGTQYPMMPAAPSLELARKLGQAHQEEIRAHTRTRAALEAEQQLRVAAEDALWKAREDGKLAEHYRQLLINRAETDPAFVNLRAQVEQDQVNLYQERLLSQQLRDQVISCQSELDGYNAQKVIDHELHCEAEILNLETRHGCIRQN